MRRDRIHGRGIRGLFHNIDQTSDDAFAPDVAARVFANKQLDDAHEIEGCGRDGFVLVDRDPD